MEIYLPDLVLQTVDVALALVEEDSGVSVVLYCVREETYDWDLKNEHTSILLTASSTVLRYLLRKDILESKPLTCYMDTSDSSLHIQIDVNKLYLNDENSTFTSPILDLYDKAMGCIDLLQNELIKENKK